MEENFFLLELQSNSETPSPLHMPPHVRVTSNHRILMVLTAHEVAHDISVVYQMKMVP
jgi:hypothetical protein